MRYVVVKAGDNAGAYAISAKTEKAARETCKEVLGENPPAKLYELPKSFGDSHELLTLDEVEG